jgi:hypothetical protein
VTKLHDKMVIQRQEEKALDLGRRGQCWWIDLGRSEWLDGRWRMGQLYSGCSRLPGRRGGSAAGPGVIETSAKVQKHSVFSAKLESRPGRLNCVGLLGNAVGDSRKCTAARTTGRLVESRYQR